MTDPITTLIQLNEASLDLDLFQTWIDGARVIAQTNQPIQLELDRQQTEIDKKRRLIELTMLDIRSRN